MRNKLILFSICIFVLTMPALAQDGPPPMPELDGVIVMQGLTSPQGILVDDEGVLWVVDSGTGGDEEIAIPSMDSAEPTISTIGNTSQIIRMMPDEEPEVVAYLPSINLGMGMDYIGGADVALIDGVVYASVGSWHISGGEEVNLPLQGTIVRIVDGEAEVVADLWANELANDPDNADLETHPYHITAAAGLIYVADAAGNALLTVDPETGEISTIANFEPLPGVFPNPIYGGEPLTDAVPTGVVVTQTGGIFVSYLSGAPFIPGSAKVVQVSAAGAVTDFATGLTMLTDLQMGPDGNLYAVSFGMFNEEGPVFNSGSIVRIFEDGTAETVIDGLPFATGLAFDANGNAYVTVNGMAVPEAGLVVYYEGLTSMEGTPLAGM